MKIHDKISIYVSKGISKDYCIANTSRNYYNAPWFSLLEIDKCEMYLDDDTKWLSWY